MQAIVESEERHHMQAKESSKEKVMTEPEIQRGAGVTQVDFTGRIRVEKLLQ